MPGPDHNPARIDLRQPGKLTKTTYANELANAINNMGPAYVVGSVDEPREGTFSFPGKIVGTGPSGEADYPIDDPRYWVEPQLVPNGGNALSPDHSLTPQPIITAINFYGEQPAVPNIFYDPNNSIHVLPVGTLVDVTARVGADGKIYYTIAKERPPGHYFCRLTHDGGSGGGSNTLPSWTYTALNIYGGVIATGQTPWNNRVFGLTVPASVGFYVNGHGTNKGIVTLDELADAEACT